jgi:DNA gyrase subunit A
VDLPAVPPNSVQPAAGVRASDYIGLTDKAEHVVAIVTSHSPTPLTLGTAQGVVKRLTPGDWATKPEFEVIALKPGDSVVGACEAADADEVVFVTSDAQLLRFSASSVRPQGRGAGGMAGVKLSAGATAVFFGAVTAAAAGAAVVVTIATSGSTLAGTNPGSGKVSNLAEFPAKGRATGGVRAQRFLKGEDQLALAWVGEAPALAVAPDGAARGLPEAGAKRDASGAPLDAVIGSIGVAVR